MAKQQTPYRMTALTDIKPYAHNPRIIPQAAVDAVARSIQAFGFRQPIVVDGNGVILAGHTRYRAAQQLGMTEVPVVWQTDITEIQARGYRIADNKVAELSAWDRDALDIEVKELSGTGDLDLDAIGLADWELERILAEDSDRRLPEEAPPKSYSQAGHAADSDAEPATPPHALGLANDCASGSASCEVLMRISFPDRDSLDAATQEITEVAEKFGGRMLGD